jgi:hypothetical protein
MKGNVVQGLQAPEVFRNTGDFKHRHSRRADATMAPAGLDCRYFETRL